MQSCSRPTPVLWQQCRHPFLSTIMQCRHPFRAKWRQRFTPGVTLLNPFQFKYFLWRSIQVGEAKKYKAKRNTTRTRHMTGTQYELKWKTKTETNTTTQSKHKRGIYFFLCCIRQFDKFHHSIDLALCLTLCTYIIYNRDNRIFSKENWSHDFLIPNVQREVLVRRRPCSNFCRTVASMMWQRYLVLSPLRGTKRILLKDLRYLHTGAINWSRTRKNSCQERSPHQHCIPADGSIFAISLQRYSPGVVVSVVLRVVMQ